MTQTKEVFIATAMLQSWFEEHDISINTATAVMAVLTARIIGTSVKSEEDRKAIIIAISELIDKVSAVEAADSKRTNTHA